MRRLSPRRPGGFTLVEILVALAVFGVVATVLTRVLISSQRVTAATQTRAMMQSNLRVASFVVPNELRMLNQADQTDILDVSDTSIVYLAMRGYYVLCTPITSASSVTVTRVLNSGFGFDYREPAAGDNAFIFYEDDTLKITDDKWVQVAISAASTATCAYPAAGTTGRTFTLNPAIATGTYTLDRFLVGAPVRTYEITRMALYTADGQKWLGMCTGSSTCALEPVVGPLADAGGFLLTRYNDAGAVVTGNTPADRNSLRSLRIRFVAKTEQAISGGVADAQRAVLTDTLSAVVTLRNVKQN